MGFFLVFVLVVVAADLQLKQNDFISLVHIWTNNNKKRFLFLATFIRVKIVLISHNIFNMLRTIFQIMTNNNLLGKGLFATYGTATYWHELLLDELLFVELF